MASPRIAVLPAEHRLAAGAVAAVEAGGAELVEVADANALVWVDPHGAEALRTVLAAHDGLDWVQLPFAGVEPFVDVIDGSRRWTCGKGVYAEPVAEHVLTLALAGFRGLTTYVPASTWEAPEGQNLLGARVTVLGAGGITESLLRLLAPFGCEITVLRRRVAPLDGALVRPIADLHDVLPTTDLLVVALALTPETDGIIGAAELALLSEHAWLVNVARGRHVDADALVDALRTGGIGGAALDVTEPEPLPAGHPLWAEPRCIITPHVANTPEMGAPLLFARITDNVRRYGRGEELVGPVDPALGY
ncbi:MAG: NAD(P)-dependent oxidoreductase [Actinomycetota bacterium]